MAATSTVAVGRPASIRPRAVSPSGSWNQRTWHAALLLLTLAMLLIHGYHPFSEDGGIYVAGVEYLIDPTLFPHFTAFVTAHLHYSIFAFSLARLVRVTHLPLPWVLLSVYLVSLWLTLYAALRILQRCGLHLFAQLAGISLLSAWATLPVAGTSLVLLDPYLTARSLSTPLSLLAIGFALDPWTARIPTGRHYKANCSFVLCLICLVLAVVIHPLMAAYAVAMVISLRAVRSSHWMKWSAALIAFALIAAAVVQALAPSESPEIVQSAISRYYWFLSQWQWYELCGLAGPVILLALMLRSSRKSDNAVIRHLCGAGLLTAAAAVLIALLFAHRDAPTHLVARLQPLRVFLLIYAVMTILLAATLTERLIATRLSTYACVTLVACIVFLNAGVLFSMQRAIYPGSQHLELPWRSPSNPWSQAFTWARNNTPKNALFALDADYITQAGEDAQTFRATAQRSSLPDFSKDGGEASITPTLAVLWQQGVTAQTDLSRIDDATRDARLHPLGVTWMVLRNSTATQHPCPYRNSIVKVCSLNP